MSNRRYGIILDPAIYQQWRLASVRAGLSVGDWLMAQLAAVDTGVSPVAKEKPIAGTPKKR